MSNMRDDDSFVRSDLAAQAPKIEADQNFSQPTYEPPSTIQQKNPFEVVQSPPSGLMGGANQGLVGDQASVEDDENSGESNDMEVRDFVLNK